MRWSEYRAAIPEYFDYKMLMQGYEPLAVQERTDAITQYTVQLVVELRSEYGQRSSGGSETLTPRVTNHRWAMKDVPALREEPYMTTTNDYVSKIDFELAGLKWPDEAYNSVAGSWTKIDDELLIDDNFGVQLNRGGFLKDQLTPLLAQTTDPAARVAAIHDLVRRSVKHNGNNGVMAGSTIRARAYDQKSGNAGRCEPAADCGPARGRLSGQPRGDEHPRPRPHANQRAAAQPLQLRAGPRSPARRQGNAGGRHRGAGSLRHAASPLPQRPWAA